MTISILQIGAENWAPYITDKLDWHYTSVLGLPTFLAMQRDPYVLEQTYVLLTDDHLESTLLSSQINEWPALRVIYFAHEVSSDFQKILDERRAFRIEENTPENIEKRIVTDMDTSQYGFSTRFSAEQFIPYVPEGIHLQRQGDFSTQFEGEFGEDWQQLGTLKAGTSDFQSGRANEVWLEYHHSEEAEPALLFVFYKNGEVLTQQLIAGQSLRQLTTVAPPEDYESYEILVLGKGQGTLDFYVIHQRASRHGLGHLLPGGTWQLTKENEEVLSYFNPGDCQKPLIVSFADTRLHVDGFEMQEALNRLGTPYLLFTDARIQGGAFDIGTAEYEATIIRIIKQKMKTLGLRAEDLILMGASMGSYPALYYAADLNPAAVIIAKPIVNLGTFTAGSTISRGFDYGWRLDVRRYLSGYVRPDDNVAMNEKLWKHIENTNWTNIKVALFSMSQDEYDGQSLGQLLDFFATHNVPVKHESEEGQHTEKLDEMVDFMMTNLNVLRNTMRAEGE